MSDVERACAALALRYLTTAEAEEDPVRRLGLLDCALDAVQGARAAALAGITPFVADPEEEAAPAPPLSPDPEEDSHG